MRRDAMTGPRVISNPRVWITSFGLATVLAIAVAAQTWLTYAGKDRPSSFLDGRMLQPQLIRWYIWALLAPAVVVVLQRIYSSDSRVRPWWRATGIYAGLGAGVIVTQAVATGFALGWWWSFPSLIPTNPQWHIAHELRSRTVLGTLIFAVI